jgi:hypothetical protein
MTLITFPLRVLLIANVVIGNIMISSPWFSYKHTSQYKLPYYVDEIKKDEYCNQGNLG